MMLTSKSLSQMIRARGTELLNLANAIDRSARLQQACLIARWRAKRSAPTQNAGTAPNEHYADLSPNPPEDPTVWRGILMRQQRNGKLPH